MKKNILTLIAIISIFSACTKDNNGTPGGDGSYQPLTAGSKWTYRNETAATGNIPTAKVDTTINTMTAITTVFDGKTFHQLNSVTGDDVEQSYLGFNNHIYTARSIEDDQTIVYDYLDETKAAGYSAVTPFEVEGAEAQIKTTVAEKGISKAILGKTYNNVIHTKLETQVKQAGQFKTVGTIDFYIAKNIGVIGIYTDISGALVTKTELISSDIK